MPLFVWVQPSICLTTGQDAYQHVGSISQYAIGQCAIGQYQFGQKELADGISNGPKRVARGGGGEAGGAEWRTPPVAEAASGERSAVSTSITSFDRSQRSAFSGGQRTS